jgi:hypothetical protein
VQVFDRDTLSSDDPMGDGAISVSQFNVPSYIFHHIKINFLFKNYFSSQQE